VNNYYFWIFIFYLFCGFWNTNRNHQDEVVPTVVRQLSICSCVKPVVQ